MNAKRQTNSQLKLRRVQTERELARIYGTRTPLPDGRTSREYLAQLHERENAAKSAGLGGWRH